MPFTVFSPTVPTAEARLQAVLGKNLELAGKQLELAASVEGELSAHLVADALENVVSAFDGFSREMSRVHAAQATNADQGTISLPNLTGAQKNVQNLFGIDLATAMDAEQWETTCRCFQRSGTSWRIAWASSIRSTSRSRATAKGGKVGRKVTIDADEVRALISRSGLMGAHLRCEPHVPEPGRQFHGDEGQMDIRQRHDS